MQLYKSKQLTVIRYFPSGAEAPVSEEWPWKQKILPGLYQFIIEGRSASRESAASEYFQETLSEVTKTVITLVNNYKTLNVIHIPYNGLVMQYFIQRTTLSILYNHVGET